MRLATDQCCMRQTPSLNLPHFSPVFSVSHAEIFKASLFYTLKKVFWKVIIIEYQGMI